MNKNISELYVIGIIITVLCFSIIYLCLRKICIDSVKESSINYNNLLKLNQKYSFHNDLKQENKFSKQLKSKGQFDRFNYDKNLYEFIHEKKDYFSQLIWKTNENNIIFSDYKREYNWEIKPPVQNEILSSIPFKWFLKIEKKLLKKNILKPVIDPIFIFEISYTSPKGQKSYHNKRIYTFQDVLSYYDNVMKQDERQNTNKAERNKMTDSLRYDVMKRDYFKCVLCGRSAKDNVKLHVDHIIPIAKGGKTEMSNLRTLCDKCNYGKKDKYDYNGVN